MRLSHGIFLLAGFTLALWLAGFIWFTREVSELMPPADPQAAAIVVLTGGGGRIDEGLRLLQANAAKRLLISGVHPDVDEAALLQNATLPVTPQLAACCIALGYAAGSTEGNATEAARWAKDNHVPSLIVVTANYHLPRALLEFHRALPKAELVPYPLPRAAVDATLWWQSSGSARLLLVEYAKYVGALLRATYDLVTSNAG